jgi:hypothetical protein
MCNRLRLEPSDAEAETTDTPYRHTLNTALSYMRDVLRGYADADPYVKLRRRRVRVNDSPSRALSDDSLQIRLLSRRSRLAEGILQFMTSRLCPSVTFP